MTPFWKKLPILGSFVMDGRWHCVISNPQAKTVKQKPAYCIKRNGVWYQDSGAPLPRGWSVTHIAHRPEVPGFD